MTTVPPPARPRISSVNRSPGAGGLTSDSSVSSLSASTLTQSVPISRSSSSSGVNATSAPSSNATRLARVASSHRRSLSNNTSSANGNSSAGTSSGSDAERRFPLHKPRDEQLDDVTLSPGTHNSLYKLNGNGLSSNHLSSGTGSVSVSIRSRVVDSDIEKGRIAYLNHSHHRHASDDDSRGLKKGWRSRSALIRLISSITILSLLVIIIYAAYVHLMHDPRSSQLTIITIVPPLSSTITDGSISVNDLSSMELIILSSITSWLHLLQPSSIILYVTSDSACKLFHSLLPRPQCYHLAQCKSQSFPPFHDLSCILQHIVNDAITTQNIGILSADIAVDERLLGAVDFMSTQFAPRWLLAGSRTDVSLTGLALRGYADEEYIPRLFNEAKERGKKQKEPNQSIDTIITTMQVLRYLMQKVGIPAFTYGTNHWSKFLLVSAMLDDSIQVVDITLAAELLHLQSISGPSVAGTSYSQKRGEPQSQLYAVDPAIHIQNTALAESTLGVKMSIGSVRYSPWILEGDCPHACVLVENPHPHWRTMLLFTQRVNDEGYIAVLTVNSGYLALAHNWLCWAERIHFTNYILLAEDEYSANIFRQRNVPVLTRPGAADRKAAADYGTVEFQETMTYRTEFLMEVLDAGYHFMTADMDAIWLSDPFLHVDTKADLSGQTHKKTKVSGGLVIVRSTDAGKAFWSEVIKCQRANAIFLSEHANDRYEPSMYTEQYCINQLYLQQPPPPAFTRTLLDPWLFPDGKFFFDEQQSQHAGVLPVIIHNNWIKGAEAKLQRMIDWGLNSTDETNTVCESPRAPPSPNIQATSASSEAGFSLVLRILAHHSPSSLQSLLTSLSSLSFPDCGPVRLEVDVDRGPEEDDDTIQEIETRHALYVQLLDLARSFKWKHGELIVRDGSQRRGRLGQFVDGWGQSTPLTSRMLVLILDEQTRVSPVLYKWLSSAVQHYYFDPARFDPRLIGIQLEVEETVLGETYWNRYPSRIPSQLLQAGLISDQDHHRSYQLQQHLYRYQSVSPYAMLLFPMHLTRFQDWLEQRGIDTITSLPPATTNNHVTPCIPLLISNHWYTPQGEHQLQHHYETEDVWWVWMQRWMYEEGLYTLNTNFHHGHAALITHNIGKIQPFLTKEQKEQLSKNQTAITLIESTDTELTMFPPLDSLRLYTFGFSPIANSSLLSVIPRLHPSLVSLQCYSAARYDTDLILFKEAETRFKQEEELKARAAQETKAKKYLSEKMKKEKKKQEAQKQRKQEEQQLVQQMKEQPFVELEGG